MKKILYSFFIMVLLGSISAGIILYGRGYRINLDGRNLTSTGILSVFSSPDSASIFINDKLISASPASLSLPPNWYKVKITKENYQPWEKNVKVQGEVVSHIDAYLPPLSPSLRSLTTSGIQTPTLSPSGNKLAYIIPMGETTPSASLKSKAGLWIMDLKNGPLGINSEAKQIYSAGGITDFSRSKILWSSDEKQIILTFSQKPGSKETVISALLFNLDEPNGIPAETVSRLSETLDAWNTLSLQKNSDRLEPLPEILSGFLKNSAANITFSPDEKRIFYMASASANLSLVITPSVIGSNSTNEIRNVEKGKYYIYDIKEDKNYFLSDNRNFVVPNTLSWFYDSKHIVMIDNNSIYIIDYDGTNKRAVYGGPFVGNLVYPWASGGKLVILANFHQPASLPNLYEIDLR